MNNIKDYYDEQLEEKMIKWGILTKDKQKYDLDEPIVIAPYAWIKSLEEKGDYKNRVSQLEKRVSELEIMLGFKSKQDMVDIIYEEFKEELEKDDLGKFVAIDIDEKKIISIGDSLIDAYKKATEISPKKQFAFRRIGYTYEYLLV